MTPKQVSDIVNKATNGLSLSHEDVMDLLSLEDHESFQLVMSAARSLREQHFGNKIFLYGFVYFSTYCKNNCTFCFYRKTNTQSPRYRKSLQEVVDISCELVDSGVHLIDLTSGEDPLWHDSGNFSGLLAMIEQVKKESGVPVMVSPGIVPDAILHAFADLDTDFYALYQETHNPILYKKLRINQSFEERNNKRVIARRLGMLVENGLLLGVGETLRDRTDSIMTMKRSDLQQVRVMSFVPQSKTPLAEIPVPSRMIEYLGIAVMRLLMPDSLIPATLDVEGIKGLRMRLEAGANVVTSIIPPRDKLAGVAQSSLDVEEGLRTVPEVEKILNDMELCPASVEEYTSWITTQRKKIPDTSTLSD
jgi:methylornithine synthase